MDQGHEESWRMRIYNKLMTWWVKLVLLVVNSVKLQLMSLFLNKTHQMRRNVYLTCGLPASSPVVPARFNVTSPVKLVGRTRLGRQAINDKSKMAEPGEESNFSRKNTAVTFRFYHLQ